MKIYHSLKNIVLSLLTKRTVGVRILLINQGNVLLVKHTYQSGWYTIGGAVDPRETPRQAIERELKEEVGATLLSPPKLFSVYYSFNEKHDDYIVFYTADSCSQVDVYSPEIAEQRWFPLNALPDDITPATRQRINEYLGTAAITDHW